jgi:hypothetical protein
MVVTRYLGFSAALLGMHINPTITTAALPSTIARRWTVVLISSLVLVAAARRTQEEGSGDPCTLCVGGGEFDTDLRIGTVPCQEVQDLLVSTPASSSVCLDAQLQGYLYCSCAEYPMHVYCSMCENGSIELANPTLVPSNGLAPKTCQESLFAKLTSNEKCQLIAEAAEECGCAAAAAPNCTFCGIGTVQNPERALPPDFQRSCQDYSDLAPTVGNATECDGLTADLPVDARTYCGCQDADAPSQNTACPGGLCNGRTIIANPDASVTLTVDPDQTVTLTCQDIFDMALVAVDERYCEMLQGYSSECCGPSSNGNPPPTSASTPAPGPAPGTSTPTSGTITAKAQTAKLYFYGTALLRTTMLLLAVLLD